MNEITHSSKEFVFSLLLSFLYLLGWVIFPPICFYIAFKFLTIFDQTALPWLTFALGPILGIIVMISWASLIAFYNSGLESKAKNIVKTILWTSIVWGPFAEWEILKLTVDLFF